MKLKVLCGIIFGLSCTAAISAQEVDQIIDWNEWIVGWNISPFSATLTTLSGSEEGPVDFGFNIRMGLLFGYNINDNQSSSMYFTLLPYGYLNATMGIGSNFEYGLKTGILRFGKRSLIGIMMPIFYRGITEYTEYVEYGEDIYHTVDYKSSLFDPFEIDLLFGQYAKYHKRKDESSKQSGLLYWAFNIELISYGSGLSQKNIGVIIGSSF